MANMDSVGQNIQNSFGYFRVTFAVPVSLANTGNAVATLPMLGGGLSNNGQVIIRRITVANPSNSAGGAVPNMSAANVTVLTSSDGNTSNAITTAAGQTLGNLTGAGTFQDLALASSTSTNTVTASALFFLVNANVANAQVQVSVYGDIVQF